MTKSEKILLAHGSGGTMMRDLIEEVFVETFGDVQLEDAATLDIDAGKLAFSTDSFVVHPLFFPGGDIGHLAVCGTVNDVATAGARPLYLSVGFILEEGFAMDDLRVILTSMAQCAREAGVKIVTGDTKVVDKGAADGIFINTTGIGLIREGVALSAQNCQVGDKILLSGTLGDHGITIVSQREGIGFGTTLETDAAPLAELVHAVLDAAPATRVFRDPTRGGLASALNEIADSSKVSMLVLEEDVPIDQQVLGACEMLGYDVFQVANEGKMIAIVPPDQAEAALVAMRGAPYGADAAIIGEVVEGPAGRVSLRNSFGATRIMDTLVGEQLPRIC
ncbi:MAG: hydrogenase expression/formation protein HypE [Actinomycetia bacterium]|nr:hydrogenase expression/formation protein HypE [Actinomycetes bacterium]